MVRLRLFASAREAAGVASDTFDADQLGELIRQARERYGADFSAVLDQSRVWVDGEEPVRGDATELSAGAEVAVLPPVSGGTR